MRYRSLILSSLTLLICVAGSSQVIDNMDDESKLYAQSKQVNQFFHRFNGEEDEKGNRYYSGDKQFRSIKLRKKYLGILFDEQNAALTMALKTDFAKYVLDHNSFLDFHGRDWFAEVHTIFTHNGKDQPVTLIMELEKDHLGSKWVIHRAHADIYDPYFLRDTARVGRFLHPMSHELDFMNLRKAFINSDSMSQFAIRRFVPDHLSVLLYDVKNGAMKFKTVDNVSFHFFQIAGWYFQIDNFNRSGYNTGWLVSNLVKLNSDEDKIALHKYLYYEKR